MNKGDILKYVLIAGAVYLVYRYLSQSGLFGSLTAADQPAVAPAQIAAPAIDTTATVVNPEKVSVTADSLASYAHKVTWPAKPTLTSDWDGKLTISEWNWMVGKMTGVEQNTDLSFGIDVPEPVTVQDYMARRVRAGISGINLGGFAQLLSASSWAM